VAHSKPKGRHESPLSGRSLIRRLIWIEALCFALLIVFISVDDEYVIPHFLRSTSSVSAQTVAGILDSFGVLLLFLLALYIQLQVLQKIKLLEGIMSVCANCKRIQDDEGHWCQIEEYIHKHSHADFSHTICPDCGVKLYGDLYLKANPAPGEPK
jgi:hypothetical protein